MSVRPAHVLQALILAALLGLASVPVRADVSGTVTILEGDASIIRGAGRLHAAEGVRLQPGDIVHAGPGSLLQVELPDRVVAQLGPQARALFGGAGGRAEPVLYLLDGWLKLTRPRREGGALAALELRGLLADLPPADSVVVLHAGQASLELFVERGEQRVVERGTGAVHVLKANDFYRRKSGSASALNPAGGLKALVQAMPQGFRDTLPLRAQRFAEKPVAPRAAPDFGYDDVADWLHAEPGMRKSFVQRWRVKSRNPAFRAALIANLPAHPEWDPVLFPEKYLPKPASSPRGSQASLR